MDSHQEMIGWERFWAQCSNVHKFLEVKERRDRYLWTCTRGTDYEEPAKDKLAAWGKTLYVKRWGSVVAWLHSALPVIRFLRATWDIRKFAQGVDDKGVVFKEDMHKSKESKEGGKRFDTSEFTKTLRSMFFDRYASMVLLVDHAPDQLSRWASGCPCHDSMSRKMSRWKRGRLMASHFGGRLTCPCTGMRAPELAVGHHERIIASWHLCGATKGTYCFVFFLAVTSCSCVLKTMFVSGLHCNIAPHSFYFQMCQGSDCFGRKRLMVTMESRNKKGMNAT